MSRRAVLPLLLVAALVGCLPRHALSRRDELAALRYQVEVGMSAPEGYGLPAWSWSATGELVFAWSRTFRDGTEGHAVRFEGIHTAGGGPAWERGVVEIRSFPSGEIVGVEGVAPFAGTAGHLELADLLWPALSPRVPDGARGESITGTAAWPVLFPTGPGPRVRVDGTWTRREGDRVVWGGVLGGESRFVRMDGRVDGAFTRTDGRLADARVDAERTVTTRWAGGVQHIQKVASSVSLRLLGETPAPPLAVALVPGDAASDATPLAYEDGRAVVPGGTTGVQLPFLAVDEATAQAIRATLASMGPNP